MNIVHVIFSLGTGGTENLLIDIVNEQVQVHNVTVIVINTRIHNSLIERIDEKVQMIFLNRKEGSRRNFVFLLRLWKVLLEIRPTVIHCHNENCIVLIPFFRKRCVVTIHDIRNPIGNLRKFNKIFSISSSVAADIKKRSNLESTIILNGIDFSNYKTRTEYSFSLNEKFRIIQVSRLVHEKKGQDVLLKALHILIHKYHIKQVKLDFIGEGPSENYLRDLTSTLDLNPFVNFLEAKDRRWVQHNLLKYHLLVQPSVYEGFGLTVLEGIAAAIPVIASRIDGPAEILNEMPSGFLFESENAESLAYKIKAVFELYQQEKIKELCMEAHNLAAAKYSIKQTAVSYLNNYQSQ